MAKRMRQEESALARRVRHEQGALAGQRRIKRIKEPPEERQKRLIVIFDRVCKDPNIAMNAWTYKAVKSLHEQGKRYKLTKKQLDFGFWLVYANGWSVKQQKAKK